MGTAAPRPWRSETADELTPEEARIRNPLYFPTDSGSSGSSEITVPVDTRVSRLSKPAEVSFVCFIPGVLRSLLLQPPLLCSDSCLYS